MMKISRKKLKILVELKDFYIKNDILWSPSLNVIMKSPIDTDWLPRYAVYKRVDLTPIDFYLFDIDYKKQDEFLLTVDMDGIYVLLPKGKSIDRVMLAKHDYNFKRPIEEELDYAAINKAIRNEFDM